MNINGTHLVAVLVGFLVGMLHHRALMAPTIARLKHLERHWRWYAEQAVEVYGGERAQ